MMKTKNLLKEVEVEFKKLEKQMGFSEGQTKIYISKTLSGATGQVTAYSSSIALTKELLDLWETDRNAVLYTLAHELAHLKYKDNRGLGLVLRGFGAIHEMSILFPVFNKAIAHTLLMEMRADFEAARVLNLSYQENWKVQECLERNNPIRNKKESFERGYPTRTMIVDYIAKYKVFDDKAKEALLKEYCEVRKINKPSKYIKNKVAAF